jgi:dTDP-4-amino-4,6-dideoxygalactose transaminase
VRLSEGLSSIPAYSAQEGSALTTQAIYQFVFKYDAEAFGGASRDRFVAALEAVGIPSDGLFYEPVYRSVLFNVDPQDFPALGRCGPEDLPWEKTSCPVAERAAYLESVWLPHQLLLGTDEDVDQIVEAVAKIQTNVDELLLAEHSLIERKQMSRVERPR